jgi:hypothetical protein
MEKYGAEELYSAVTSLMHAIWNIDKKTEPGVAHRMIQIAKA